MKSWLDRATRILLRKGLRRGLGGDGRWLAVGALAWFVRFLMKKREPEVVRESLRPGETLVVTNLGPPPRGRKARRAFDEARDRAPLPAGAAE